VAGGLDAFQALLGRMPDSGLAFVFVPDSPVDTTLASLGGLPVHRAAAGMALAEGNIYVLPSDAGLEFGDGHFRSSLAGQQRGAGETTVSRLVLSVSQVRAGISAGEAPPADSRVDSVSHSTAGIQEQLTRAIAGTTAGVALAISKDLDVLDFAGPIEAYLSFPEGQTTGKLLRLIPEVRLLLVVEALLRKCQATGESARKDRVSHYNNGEEEELSVEIRPLAEGPASVLLVLFEPQSPTMIEKRNRAEADLALADRLSGCVIESVPTPMAVLDREFRLLLANRTFLIEFAMKEEEAIGKPLELHIPNLRENFKRVLQIDGHVESFEFHHTFPGSPERVFALTGRRMREFPRIVVSAQDVTGRHEAESDTREGEGLFRRIADSAPIMIWLSNVDWRWTFVNKPWALFTGRSLQRELGNGWFDGIHPEDRERCREICTTSTAGRRSFQMDFRLRRHDGEYRWVILNATPLLENGETLTGFAGTCLDINEVKSIPDQDYAKQKLETVGTLAAGIAHDFNNLLASVLAHSELALSEIACGATPVQELERIRATSLRGAEIVRQLMIYAGQESEVLELVDVAGLVEDMLHLLRVSVSKRVTLETHFDAKRSRVRASPTQIRQIAMNLITNASEALGDNEGVIRITTAQVAVHPESRGDAGAQLAPGEYLQLIVMDSGRGMSAEVQARIFEPYFTTKATGSHGQGLVVVRRIVQSLGGTVQVASTPGKGATFRVLLPAAGDAARGSEEAVWPANEEAGAAWEATILVVDDEDMLRQAISAILRKKGMKVIEASDGTAALEVIRGARERIDLLLLDVTLPGASSRDVFQEAKRRQPEMAVVVTSAKSEEMAVASIGVNIDHYLRKPYRSADLFNVLRRLTST